MSYLRKQMMEQTELLLTVDFSQVANYQVMKRVYHQLVSQHHFPGDLAAEISSGMQINVSDAALQDEEFISAMITGTCVAASRLYRQLEIDFGVNRASLMLKSLTSQFSITYDVP